MKDIQRRDLKITDVKTRETENGKRMIEGMIPYNQRSEYMGFYEYITPSAFNKTLADGADVRAFQNHDTTLLLGRVKNGSLRLRSDEVGLHIECDLPDTSYGENVYNLIRDGYNTGMSFGFTTVQDRWETQEIDGRLVDVCYLLEVRLYEVSFCVSFPAYEATNSKARSVRSILDDFNAIKPEDLSEEDKQAINTKLRELIPEVEEPAPAEPTPAAESTEAEIEQERQLDALLNELRNKEKSYGREKA